MFFGQYNLIMITITKSLNMVILYLFILTKFTNLVTVFIITLLFQQFELYITSLKQHLFLTENQNQLVLLDHFCSLLLARFKSILIYEKAFIFKLF